MFKYGYPMLVVGASLWVLVFHKKYANFSDWYRKVLSDADVVDQRFPVKGCLVWKGYGTKIMENIMKLLERLLDETEHVKMYFPLLIPEDLFGKESRHLRGFEDQVYWVTRAGRKKMSRRLILRPTSETAMYPMFSLWVRSHADLPFKVYQTVSVFRYESKSTAPLIRDREMRTFNEAHTVHASLEEAKDQICVGLEIYKQVFRKLALPFLLVEKPEWELFPGAVGAFEFYVLFPDGRVLETGSVNNLGQAFSRVFDIKNEQEDGSHEFVWQTCYGQTERLLAGVVSVHGDDHGLVLPSSVAPVLIVVVPIVYEECEEGVMEFARHVVKLLKEEGFSVELDAREKMTPSEKFYYWEMLGVPVRLEVGLKEVKKVEVTLVRRDMLERKMVSLKDLAQSVRDLLKRIDEFLWSRAERGLKENIMVALTLKDAVNLTRRGKAIVKTFWCGKERCKEEVEKKTRMEIIGYAVDEEVGKGEKCLVCGGETRRMIYLAKTH